MKFYTQVRKLVVWTEMQNKWRILGNVSADVSFMIWDILDNTILGVIGTLETNVPSSDSTEWWQMRHG